MPKVFVEFDVSDEERFEASLKLAFEDDLNVVGLRTGYTPAMRAPLRLFAEQMELKLRKNDHKTSWRELPVEALFKMLLVELEEYRIAHEYLKVSDARGELVDIGNFALILWDRLSLEDQEKKIG